MSAGVGQPDAAAERTRHSRNVSTPHGASDIAMLSHLVAIALTGSDDHWNLALAMRTRGRGAPFRRRSFDSSVSRTSMASSSRTPFRAPSVLH